MISPGCQKCVINYQTLSDTETEVKGVNVIRMLR